jgi:hypothetical protein
MTDSRRSKPCGTCGGGGLVLPPDCRCKGLGHTCAPRVCPACGGSGYK